jgi:aminopeptidase C
MFVNYEDEQSELDFLIGRLAPDHDDFKIKFIKFILKQPDANWDMIEKMIEEYGRYDNEIAITEDTNISSSVAEAEEKYIKNVLKRAPQTGRTALNSTEESNLKENT